MHVPIKDKSPVLPEGEYDFEVCHAHESGTQGKQFLVLKLKVGTNGSAKMITDYIDSGELRKLRMLAKTCDLIDLYESGQILDRHFIGRRGRVSLGIEKSTHKDYSDRNVVESYGGRAK